MSSANQKIISLSNDKIDDFSEDVKNDITNKLLKIGCKARKLNLHSLKI